MESLLEELVKKEVEEQVKNISSSAERRQVSPEVSSTQQPSVAGSSLASTVQHARGRGLLSYIYL